MGGRPEGAASDAGAWVLVCASAMTVSARWRECCRVEVLDWRVEFREFREEISLRRWVIADWRERDCECRELAAVSDWVVDFWRFSDRDLETADWRASFSGFGGMGGGGPVDMVGRSISKGEVSRSGVSTLGFGAGGWIGWVTGCG